jgi:RND family efflux transporter MFP subunit
MSDFRAEIITRIKKLPLGVKVALVVILTLAIFLIYTNMQAGKSPYVFANVSKATIVQEVAEIGNISTGASININSPATGVVEEVYVNNGDYVTVGTPLFRVRSTATEQQKSEALSNYLTAVTALDDANSSLYTLRSAMYDVWDTYRDLATGDEYETADGKAREENRLAAEFQIARDDWLAAEKQYKDQQTAVNAASAKVSTTWLAYQATQNADVKATSDGVVANLAVSPGSGVTAPTAVIPGVTAPQTPVLSIVDASVTQYVQVPINEIDIPKIKVGQKATVEVDAIEDKKFRGTVDRVDIVGTNNQGVITYNVYVNISNPDPRLRSQMTANVTIETETKINVLSVPNSAVKPYQGGRAVQVLENGKQKYIPVIVGIRGDARTEIIKGVSEGRQIIIGDKKKQSQPPGFFGS